MPFRPLETIPRDSQIIEIDQPPATVQQLIPEATLLREKERWQELLGSLGNDKSTRMRAASSRIAVMPLLTVLDGLIATREQKASRFDMRFEETHGWQVQAHWALAISRLIFEADPKKLDPYQVQLDYDGSNYADGGLHLPKDIARSVGIELDDNPSTDNTWYAWYEGEDVYVEAIHPVEYSESLRESLVGSKQMGGLLADLGLAHTTIRPHLKESSYRQAFFPDPAQA